MADNPGIGLQFFGNRELTDSTFTRPGTIVPHFAPPVIGFHDEEALEASGTKGYPKGPRRTIPTSNPVPSTSNRGILIDGFYDRFWKNRVHLIPKRNDAGNVITAVSGEFEIYNSGERFIDIRTVVSLSDLESIGISIIAGDVAFPYQLGLQQSKVYEYLISPDGPGTVNDAYDVTFGDGLVLSHTITASRIFLLMAKPQKRFVERWAWATSIIKKASGREQRISVRDLPRQQIVHAYLYGDEVENMKLENALYGRLPLQVAIPFWRDWTTLTADVLAGDLVLPVADTSDRSFRIGEDVVIFNPDTLAFEVGYVAAVAANSITLNTPLLEGWEAGVEVLPVVITLVDNPQGQTLWRNDARVMEVAFNVLENADYADESGWTTYLSAPVYTDPKIMAGPTQTRQFDHAPTVFDNRTGILYQSGLRDFPDVSGSLFVAEFHDRAQLVRIRNFLHARRGRQKAFWLSTGRTDFFPVPDQTQPAGTQALDTVSTNFRNVWLRGVRRHIEIEYRNGAIDRREITDVHATGAGEQIVIGPAGITNEWSPANVVRASILQRVRLDIDTLEFVQTWEGEGRIRLLVREIIE